MGLFQSICPTFTYQPGKVNAVADALSRSQRKEGGESTDDLATVALTMEEQVLAPSGFSMELMVEDLQQWTEAYKRGEGHVATYTKLCQG